MEKQQYTSLIKQYPKFTYERYEWLIQEQLVNLTFYYRIHAIEGVEYDLTFKHQVSYEMKGHEDPQFSKEALEAKREQLEHLAFHIGLMETINYWKTTCSQELHIACGSISETQKKWWQKLFYNGLGEFIYLNGLYIEKNVTQERFVNITCNPLFEEAGNFEPEAALFETSGNMIPVGGGKDSVVTLELLKHTHDSNICFVLSPPKAAIDCIEVAGYDRYLLGKRIFDKRLLTLNDEGFLNGHVPYSAILAFIATLGAALVGKKYITLSNERSANEPSVIGTDFNHQYSKSFEFEQDFNDYLHQYIVKDIRYFSLLRRMYEIEIAEAFAKHKAYHSVFRSCNRGKTTNSWCCDCPKCLFVYIILAPHLELDELIGIFGQDLFEKKSLEKDFRELLGLEETKPFECVGTIWEVRYAMKEAIGRHYGKTEQAQLPYLVQIFLSEMDLDLITNIPENHEEGDCIPEVFNDLLQAQGIERFLNKKIVILGFGREGQSTYRFLRKYLPNQVLTIMDQNMAAVDAFFENEMDSQVVILPAKEFLKIDDSVDFVFKTPGIPGKNLSQLPEKCVITSQMDEFLRLVGQRVIGITGTKGKSTTSTLLHETLLAYGIHAELVGNIGYPVLDYLPNDTPETWYVAEMSSHQLEQVHYSPHIGVVMNLFEEHLDHYHSYEHYIQAKMNIGRFQKKGDLFIYGIDNALLRDKVIGFKGLQGFGKLENNHLNADGVYLNAEGLVIGVSQGKTEMLVQEPLQRKLIGEHNLINSLVVIQVLQDFGMKDLSVFKQVFAKFTGLEHRLEYVGMYKNIQFYNDSISTIPSATICAAGAIPEAETFIIGGFDRGIDYEPLIAFIMEKPQYKWICLPTTGHEIKEQISQRGAKDVQIQCVDNLETAVSLAYEWTTPGYGCVLSPAASSYNTFKDFIERGTVYKKFVKQFGER